MFCCLSASAQDFVPFLWTPGGSPVTGNGLLNNLLAFWEFDEASGNALDSSGNGHTLTATGTPGSGTGVVAGSRTYDETNPDYFTEAFATAYGFVGGSFTIAGWGQFDIGSPHIDDKSIIARGDFGGSNFSWALIFDNASPNDLISFYWSTDGLFNPANVVSFDLGGSVSVNYYFVCLRWDGVNLHLSATESTDSAVAADTTAAFSGSFWNSGSPTLSVGRLEGSSAHYMRGQTDNMGVWSSYLSDCQVGWLFTSKLGVFTYQNFDALNCGDSENLVNADDNQALVNADDGLPLVNADEG